MRGHCWEFELFLRRSDVAKWQPSSLPSGVAHCKEPCAKLVFVIFPASHTLDQPSTARTSVWTLWKIAGVFIHFPQRLPGDPFPVVSRAILLFFGENGEKEASFSL